MSHNPPGPAGPGVIRLANLEGARGRFSGKTIDYQAPCTSSEVHTCHLARELSVWNEFLQYVEAELQLVPGKSGLLRLVRTKAVGRHFHHLKATQVHQSVSIIYWLLRNHRCIVSFEAHPDILRMYSAIFSRILHKNTKLKVVKLDMQRTGFLESFRTAVPYMIYLQELQCKSNESCPARLLTAVSRLLRNTISLTVLSTSAPHIDGHPAEKTFFVALSENSTLQELTLDFDATYGPYKQVFQNYIESTATLKCLSITAASQSGSEEWLGSILKGLLLNKSLTSITLKNFRIDHIRVQILTKAMLKNRVLQILDMESLRAISTRQHRSVGERCIAAIIQNDSLKELSLPPDIFEPGLWNYFFREMPKQRTLMINLLWDIENRPLMEVACKELKDSSAEETVCYETRCCDWKISPEESEAFSEICLSNHSISAFEHVLLQRSSMFTRLKKLSFAISPSGVTHVPAIATYIGVTSTLRELNILAWSRGSTDDVFNYSWARILLSLVRNSSVVDLEVLVIKMDAANLERFADTVKASQSIRRLNVMMVPRQESIIFLRRLSAGIDGNYTLTRVVLLTRIEQSEEWFSITDTARRNSDLVNRAIVFATASRFDKYCATSLKPVAEHRALLQEFAEIATVSEAEAAGMIRSALHSLQDMHKFMQAVGVVRERVVCYPREDGAMQLDELPFDCWLHVRQHLQLEDVKYPGPPS